MGIQPNEDQFSTATQEQKQPRSAEKRLREGIEGRVEKTKIPILHTLKGDMEEYIKQRNLSMIDVAAENAKKQNNRSFYDLNPNNKSKILIWLVAIVLLIAGAAFGGWQILIGSKTSTPQSGNQENEEPSIPRSLVFSNKQIVFNLNSEKRSDLMDIFDKIKNTDIESNGILDALILKSKQGKKEFLLAKDLFDILEINPVDFIQSLEQQFMFGVFHSNENVPFLIFKIRSFELALSGLLQWEKNMSRDLSPIFPATENRQDEQKFQDKIIKNRDSRLLYGDSGILKLVYSFPNQKYLIITNNLNALNAIFQRFANSPQN